MSDILIEPSWRDRIDGLWGRRRESWVVVAAVAAFVAIGMMLWTRGAPAEIAPPSIDPGASTAQLEGPSASTVVVHVSGVVRRPGVYELPPGARVAEAIEAAGGPLRRADLGALNLAQVLLDGVKVDVVSRRSATPLVASPSAPAVVSLNSGDAAAIEAIPGIGPVKAAAILDYRAQAGGFSSIEQLLEVQGIGPATLEAIRPYVTL